MGRIGGGVLAAVVVGLVVSAGVVVATRDVVTPAVADEKTAGAAPTDDPAGVLVMRQIEALRAQDFNAAYALASRELRRHFSRGEFAWMMKRAHPEVASSAYAFVVRIHEAQGFVYVTVKVHGKNGKDVEALYEIVREGDALKVNAVSSRRDAGVL